MQQFTLKVPRKVHPTIRITLAWGTKCGTIHGPARPIKATKSATSGSGGQPAAAITGLGDRLLHDRSLVGLCVV